jgi:uncharacterized protein (DUF1697 family)
MMSLQISTCMPQHGKSGAMRYVALLRGINVGGKNLIKMPALKACFEAQGLTDVTTYIASGNVLFSSSDRAAALQPRLEAALADAFAYDASVVLRTRAQYAATIAGAPKGFGAAPDRFRYDVIFLKSPLTAAAAMKQVLLRDGVDAAHAGPGALYVSRLAARAAQSQLSRVASLPIYQQMTIRNWNTSTALLRLLG